MREGVNKVALCLFEHNEKAYHAAVRMMEQYGKAAIVHPTGHPCVCECFLPVVPFLFPPASWTPF